MIVAECKNNEVNDADFAAAEIVAAKSYHDEAAAPPWFHTLVQAALAPIRADLSFIKTTLNNVSALSSCCCQYLRKRGSNLGNVERSLRICIYMKVQNLLLIVRFQRVSQLRVCSGKHP